MCMLRLAHRLGLQSIKHELEDISFKILFNKQNKEIQEQVTLANPNRLNK